MPRLALDGDPSAGLHDDPVDRREPEARALTARLGREERLEQSGLGLIRHPAAVVADRQRDVGPGLEALRERRRVLERDRAGLDLDRAAAAGGVPRVDHQVHEDLLELTAIGAHRGQAPGERRGELDVLADHPAQHGDHVHDQMVQVDRDGLHHVAPAERQELLGQRRGAARGLDDLFDVVPLLTVGRRDRARKRA